jgi:peptide/nickel transport system ATP-binding protein
LQTKPETHEDVLLDVEDLEVHFQLRGGALAGLFGRGAGTVKAVDGVNLGLRKGEVLGLVGESGSGKTTLGRALLGLVESTGGRITYRQEQEDGQVTDQVVTGMRNRDLRMLRTDLQMVFQDPHAALNPSMTIEKAVGHPLQIHKLASGEELHRRVCDALERVGLAPVERFLSKLPADLSGGQKQRAVIARAIIMDPEILVADEPVSMLDMSVRAKILQLMLDLKDQLGLTYVYITHDLASAKYFCDRVAIMYLGRIVEIGPTEEIFADPKHPYTKALLKAIPDPDPSREIARDLPRGEIPDAAVPPLGCSFHPRCPVAVAECGWESRDLRVLLESHWLRQHPDVYERERELVGDLDALDSPGTEVTVGSRGTATEVKAMLDGIRDEDPEEPFWHGVRDMEVTGDGVRITFHDGVDPLLRASGGVEVACVLHPQPVTLEPAKQHTR